MKQDSVEETLESAEEIVSDIEKGVDATFKPLRQSVLRRFPILFLLLVTFGVAATFFGFERLLMEFTFVNDRPWLMLTIGVVVLLGTGTLYKKLG